MGDCGKATRSIVPSELDAVGSSVINAVWVAGSLFEICTSSVDGSATSTEERLSCVVAEGLAVTLSLAFSAHGVGGREIPLLTLSLF